MIFGAHMSIAGGLYKAYELAAELNCQTMQVFTKNARQLRAPDLTQGTIDDFKRAGRKFNIKPVVAHDSYLINLASPDKKRFTSSIEAFIVELRRADTLAIPYLVTHPGSHMGAGDETGLKNMVRSLNQVCRRTPKLKTMIILETTAGQGTNLGYKFEHLRYVIDNVKEPERFGVCLDTCHIFAAGYDISSRNKYEQTMQEFEKVIGLNQLKVIHLNDAIKECGSRVDRHTHIGKGMIGLAGFRALVNDNRLKLIPMILETPKGEDAFSSDQHNLKTLRALVR